MRSPKAKRVIFTLDVSVAMATVAWKDFAYLIRSAISDITTARDSLHHC
jgi:hypothetical protein